MTAKKFELTLLDTIHVMGDPVSKTPVKFCGGVPSKGHDQLAQKEEKKTN